MDIDFSDMLSDPDFVEPFTVTRRDAVVFGDDYRTIESRHDAVGSIQPATPKELERLPEEDRDKETVSIHTAFPLRTGGRDTARPDRITRTKDGAAYLVASVEPWGHLGCEFVKALAQRELE